MSETRRTIERDAGRGALVLFAHGARDPEWALPFHGIRERVLARRPDLAVELAFLEFMPPTLGETVERLARGGCRRISIAPLFMAQGGHLKHDLPRLLDALRAAHPGVSIALLPALGDVAAIREAIGGWLAGSVPR
jgi:sirohydrochlorin cobaltochelatase